MPVLMKDKYYNYDSLHDLASRIKAVFPSFQENEFVDHIMNETWDALELKNQTGVKRSDGNGWL